MSLRKNNNYMLEFQTCNVSRVKLTVHSKERNKKGRKKKKETKRYSTPKVGP
jgi:hypothetical protein